MATPKNDPTLALLAVLMSLGEYQEPEIPKPPILSDGEIRKGKHIEDGMEFADMLFRRVIGEPTVTFSGLVYSYNEKKEIFYTELPPAMIDPSWITKPPAP